MTVFRISDVSGLKRAALGDLHSVLNHTLTRSRSACGEDPPIVTHFLTPHEDIALNLIFDPMKEHRFNRTTEEYIDIARRLPPLKALHVVVNQRLREFQCLGKPPFKAISHFRAGHTKVWEEPYPTSISMQTIRTALNKSGMRLQRRRKKPIDR